VIDLEVGELMDGETFSTAHIALTGLITGVLSFAVAWWLLRHEDVLAVALVGIISGLAVFLWRQSANMPQLNMDGIEGFSANDWLAPVVVYVALGCTSAFRPAESTRPFAKASALATIIALIVNVVTI